MDVNRLSQGEKIAGVSAILLFISMFFAWFGFDTGVEEIQSQFGIDVGPTSFTFNAWESFDFIDLILLLTVVVAVATVALRASDMAVEFPLNSAVAVLGGLSFLLVLYRIIDTPGGSDREWGVFLGLILTALVAFGGYRAMEEEGISFGDAADRLGSGGDGGGGQPPAGGPPPPPPPPPSQTPPPPPPPPGSGV
jgi:multisubunit Na+/H+ antiporter MnhF subunit